MNRAIREVHDLLGMTQGEHAVRSIGRGVAGVSSGRRIAETKRDLHIAVSLNRSGESAVADHEQLAVPIVGRQPQLGVDLGVWGRLEYQLHAAVLRNRLRRSRRGTLWRAAATTGLDERSGGN